MNRTERLRRQALVMLNDRYSIGYETPREPLPAEALYIEARELFAAGRICAGCDKLDEGDALSGLKA